MIDVVLKPCTAIFSAQPDVGKTHKVLDLLENDF